MHLKSENIIIRGTLERVEILYSTHPDGNWPPDTESDKSQVDEPVPGGELSSFSWLERGVKHNPTAPTISSTLASYTVFSDAKINGVLYPGNELNGVDDAHKKIDASDHQKPHKFFLASLIFLLRADHEWSREYER